MRILSLLALFLIPVQTPANLKAKQLIQSSLQVLGGQRYLDATYRSGRGIAYSFDSTGQIAGGAGNEFWFYYKFPGQERLELTKHRNVIDIYSGGKGWEITYKGVAPMLPQQLSAFADNDTHSLQNILKTWAADPNTLILYQGITQYDQAQVESVSFTTQNGDNAVVDFALDTHLPVRVHWRRNDPQTGGHYQESVVFGDWSKVNGIETPFTVDQYEGNSRQSELFYNAVSFKPFSAAVFTPKELKH